MAAVPKGAAEDAVSPMGRAGVALVGVVGASGCCRISAGEDRATVTFRLTPAWQAESGRPEDLNVEGGESTFREINRLLFS